MKLNPFAGLPNPKAVWAWGMFDLEPLQQLACLLWYEVIEFDKGCPAYQLL